MKKINKLKPNEELLTLLIYFINHNKSHEKEIKELLKNKATKDSKLVSKYIKEALLDYSKGNKKLNDAVKELKK